MDIPRRNNQNGYLDHLNLTLDCSSNQKVPCIDTDLVCNIFSLILRAKLQIRVYHYIALIIEMDMWIVEIRLQTWEVWLTEGDMYCYHQFIRSFGYSFQGKKVIFASLNYGLSLRFHLEHENQVFCHLDLAIPDI